MKDKINIKQYFINKKRSKLIIIGILIFVAIVSVIGYTYSFFTIDTKDEITITAGASSPSVSLEVTKVAPVSPNTDNGLIPQLDSAIADAVIGTQGNCVDDNLNAICQVYKLTVTNVGSSSTYVNGKLELSANDNPNLKWAEVSGLTNTTLKSEINLHSDEIITTNDKYQGGETKDYYIVIWISEIGAEQTDSGLFSGVVTFESVVKMNQALVTLTKLGVEPESTILTSFRDTNEYDGTLGVYETEDDLGTSYYYRGDVTNNYVKFGKDSNGYDMWWRIIRINGDGSIRMIYDGNRAYANNESSENRHIGNSSYNLIMNNYEEMYGYNDNAFIGYMNGTIDGKIFPNGTGVSTSYAEAHANRTNSTIKSYINNWYKENIVDTGYSENVVDAIYCNNRKIMDNEILLEMLKEQATEEGLDITNTGYGNSPTEVTFYDSFDNYDMDLLYEGIEAFSPSLKCLQKNDRFTTNVSVGDVTGNGKLEYPVGLVTLDEVIFAGGYTNSNDGYYLYTGYNYWTMSPIGFMNGMALMVMVDSDGFALGQNAVAMYDVSIKPVISLSATAITGGTGTSTNPYIVP